MESKSKATKKKISLRKEDIGTPTNFVHVQHVGFKPIKTRDLDDSHTSQSEMENNQFDDTDDFSSDEDRHPLVCTCPPEYSPYHKKDFQMSNNNLSTPAIPEHRDIHLDDYEQYSPPLKPLPPKPMSTSNLALNMIPGINLFKSNKSSQSKNLPPSKIPRTKSSFSRTTSTSSPPPPVVQVAPVEDTLPPPATPNVQRRMKSPGSLFRRRSFSIHGGTLPELPAIKTGNAYRSSVCLPNATNAHQNISHLATLGKSNTFVRQRRPLPAIPPPTAPEDNDENSDAISKPRPGFLTRGNSFTLTRRGKNSRPLPPTPPTTPNPAVPARNSNNSMQGQTLPKLQVPLVPVSKVSPLTPSIWPLAPMPFVPLPSINDHGSTTGFVAFDSQGHMMADEDYDHLPPPPPIPTEIAHCYRHRYSPSIISLPEPPPDPTLEIGCQHYKESDLPEPPPSPPRSHHSSSSNIYSTIQKKDFSGSRMSLMAPPEDFPIQESQLEKITKILGDKVFYSQWPSIMEQLFSQTNFRHFGESSDPSKHYTDIVRKTLELWLVMNPEHSTFESLLKAVEEGRHKLAADTLKESRGKIYSKT